MSLKAAKIVSAISIFISLGLACTRVVYEGISPEASKVLLIIALVFFGVWFVVTAIWCRCPNCKRVIIQGLYTRSNCPYCKTNLYEKKTRTDS